MLRKTKEKERVTIVTWVQNEIASKICLIMEIMSGISGIRTSRLWTEGREWTGRRTRGSTNDLEGCVKVWVCVNRSRSVQTHRNCGKRLDYGGNGREGRGMVRTT